MQPFVVVTIMRKAREYSQDIKIPFPHWGLKILSSCSSISVDETPRPIWDYLSILVLCILGQTCLDIIRLPCTPLREQIPLGWRRAEDDARSQR